MKRRGFSLIEVIFCTVMLALIVVAVAAGSQAIGTLRTNTRDSVYLSHHNLNTMERLRQECLNNDGLLLNFYGDDTLGTNEIETSAYLSRATWDHFYIYSVRIESKTRDTKQRLNSEYVITSIGGSTVSLDGSEVGGVPGGAPDLEPAPGGVPLS